MWRAPRLPRRILVSSDHRSPAGTRRPAPRRRSADFRLEALEDRTLLSTVTSLLDNGTSGTLRYQIKNDAPGETITFAPTLFRSGPQTITLSQAPDFGELLINKNLTILGPGACLLTISGSDASRVFDIQSGNVTIAGLTIAHGLATGDTVPSPTLGGGILNQGGLTLSNDVFSENQALGKTGVLSGQSFSGGAGGGAVANLATLSATNCQFLSNQVVGADASQGFAAGIARGGAIANTPSAALTTITDCRFTGNVAQGGNSEGGPLER